jgi:hypothetical protein
MFFFLLIHKSLGVIVEGDMAVSEDTSCNTLYSANITTAGSVLVDTSLVVETLSASYISTETLTLSTLRSSSGTIEIEGDVVLSPSSSSSSFYQNSWTVGHRDTFEDSSRDWSSDLRGQCKDQVFLQGDCSSPEISKKFVFSEHRYVRIMGSLHLLDSWKGERLEIRLDGKTVWSRIGKSRPSSFDLCTEEHAGLGIKFDVMVPHSSPEGVVSFVSSLKENNCLGRFALNEVAVLTR